MGCVNYLDVTGHEALVDVSNILMYQEDTKH
jgi:hypothetical protein